jgi:phage repressor protein C with HTH and peptisase S24 domain
MEFKDALKAARKQAKLTQNQLAEALEVSREAVSSWENGVYMPESGRISQIADALGVGVGELFDEQLPISARSHAGAKDSGRKEYVVNRGERHPPVVGTAQLGSDGYWLELDYPVGHGDGFVRYPSRDPNAYALRCKGDSMRPRIKPGEFIVVEPNHAYAPGEEVVIKDRAGRVMVKVFNFNRGGVVEFSSINEDHKPITLETNEIEYIHYVAGIFKPSLYYWVSGFGCV